MRVIIYAIAIAIAIALATTSAAYSADMFIYKDDNGVLLLTDNPFHSKASENFKKSYSMPGGGINGTKSNVLVVRRYDTFISSSAKKYRLDPNLVRAVVIVESGYNERATSSSGARGLMQLMPMTAQQLGVENCFDPKQNIEGGTKYLRYLIDRFGGDITLALAAYNAGPLNVEKHGKVPPFNETKRYISKIYDIYKGHKKLDPKKNAPMVRRIQLGDGSYVYIDAENYKSFNF